MRRKEPIYLLEEKPGDLYPDLATIQQQALDMLAGDLAESLRVLLAMGLLIEKDGRIIPNPEKVHHDF